jgi:hypothetical protein
MGIFRFLTDVTAYPQPGFTLFAAFTPFLAQFRAPR